MVFLHGCHPNNYKNQMLKLQIYDNITSRGSDVDKDSSLKDTQQHTHTFKFCLVIKPCPNAFQFLYMTLAIDIIDRHGLSNEVHES